MSFVAWFFLSSVPLDLLITRPDDTQDLGHFAVCTVQPCKFAIRLPQREVDLNGPFKIVFMIRYDFGIRHAGFWLGRCRALR